MRILVACEYSGRVRDAFINKGHDAISCDLLPTDAPGPHYQGDVRDILDDGWDMMIAHQECTYLTNSGVRWLHKDVTRWPKLFKGAAFFKEMLNAKIPRKCIENPIMHKYAIQLIGRKHNQLIQPYMFGHPERKATCFWLDGLDPLIETNNVKTDMEKLPKRESRRIHYASPGPDRWKLRSTTFSGVANAMADQWG